MKQQIHEQLLREIAITCTKILTQKVGPEGPSTAYTLAAEIDKMYAEAGAGVAELADAPGLGPGAVRRGGSSPSARTITREDIDRMHANPWPRH